MEQQIATFEEMFDHVHENGVYLAEDLHTSYWLEFGGGYKRKGSFIEYSKNFIDLLNAYHSQQHGFQLNYFTRSVNSIHYYDSILVIEKKKKETPREELTGNMSFEFVPRNEPRLLRNAKDVSLVVLRKINKVLQFLRLPGFILK